MSAPDGGPAFPQSITEICGLATNSSEFACGGMSLRDYFAGQAMASYIAIEGPASDEDGDFVAKYAYEIAGAMLTERAK